MSIFFEILVRIASYGPKIDQSHGENGLSRIIIEFNLHCSQHTMENANKGFLFIISQEWYPVSAYQTGDGSIF